MTGVLLVQILYKTMLIGYMTLKLGGDISTENGTGRTWSMLIFTSTHPYIQRKKNANIAQF